MNAVISFPKKARPDPVGDLASRIVISFLVRLLLDELAKHPDFAPSGFERTLLELLEER